MQAKATTPDAGQGKGNSRPKQKPPIKGLTSAKKKAIGDECNALDGILRNLSVSDGITVKRARQAVDRIRKECNL